MNYLILKPDDVFFILGMLFLFFFCLYLLSMNKKLKEKISKLETENKDLLENKIIKKHHNKDLVSMQTISNEEKGYQKKNISMAPPENRKSKSQVSSITTMDSNKEITKHKNTDFSHDSKKEKNSIQEKKNLPPNSSSKKFEKAIYQKNILQTNKKTTAPIAIDKKDSFDIDKLSFDLNEFIKKSEKIVPKIKENPPTEEYLEELSKKMADELKPQTIELTDYEKEQEEHAIISYQELLSLKDKLSREDEEEENINFIEELKNLRNHLN